MSKKQKLINLFFKIPPPKDFRWDDLKTMMESLGFSHDASGGGSHGHFVKNDDPDKVVDISRPHPNGILLAYQIKEVKSKLKDWNIVQ